MGMEVCTLSAQPHLPRCRAAAQRERSVCFSWRATQSSAYSMTSYRTLAAVPLQLVTSIMRVTGLLCVVYMYTDHLTYILSHRCDNVALHRLAILTMNTENRSPSVDLGYRSRLSPERKKGGLAAALFHLIAVGRDPTSTRSSIRN